MSEKNKISASSNGSPPLSGAEFFARLIISMESKPKVKLVSETAQSHKIVSEKRG